MAVVRDGARVQVYSGGGYPKLIVPLLQQAKGSIDCSQYVWRWYTRTSKRHVMGLSYALIEAARRGVQCRVLLNREARRNPVTRYNEKTARHLAPAGVKVKLGRTGKADHAKLWIIDKQILVVGSHNMTARSMTCNWEMGAIIWNELAARDAAALFEKRWRAF